MRRKKNATEFSRDQGWQGHQGETLRIVLYSGARICRHYFNRSIPLKVYRPRNLELLGLENL